MYAALIRGIKTLGALLLKLLFVAFAGAFRGLYIRYHMFFLDRKYRKILDDAFIQDAIRKAGSSE